jgi:hypothetical protein
MTPLEITALVSHGMRAEYARSALPDAPVVPDKVSAWSRSRVTLASLLHRIADVLAPPVPATTGGRRTLSAGGRVG